MKIQIVSVQASGSEPRLRPRIVLYASSFSDLGFVPCALVQALPKANGMDFVLCDENICKYSSLAISTELKGGSLVHVSPSASSPEIRITGQYIRNGGLDFGDNLLALFEYGLIRVRKLPSKTQYVPGRHLVGNWLYTHGFSPNDAITVEIQPDSVMIRLWEDESDDYGALVRYARQNKLKVLQVQKFKNNQTINLPPSVFEKAGFKPEDEVLASYDYGFIKLQKLDFEKLGF